MGEKNYELNDEMMAVTSGGVEERDPYGYVCEATVISEHSSLSKRTDYIVDSDNGKKYIGLWEYDFALDMGSRVQLIHNRDDSYTLEPILG